MADDSLPSRIFAQASPRSIGGVSVFDADRIGPDNVAAFASDTGVVLGAVSLLREYGFDVLQISPISINFAGTQEQFARAFKTELVQREVDVLRPSGERETRRYIDSAETGQLGLLSTAGTRAAELIEGVAIEEKRECMAPSPIAPSPGYWHLAVPDEVAALTGALPLHPFGVTGAGVKVAMVDSGWFAHPFFASRGYQAQPVLLGPGASAPDHDESGHGTGESANIFALAPQVALFPVKMSMFNSIGAFNAAVGLDPDIITCSWGSSRPLALSAADNVLAASVASAVARGITVIFSAGNGHAGFPGQHPDVISAGGVFVDEAGGTQASNYSSAFSSQIYQGRHVPDLSGLVGMRPKAAYIMLPIEPGCEIDRGCSADGAAFPNGDQTGADDGWAAFSGTSAAAPQLAGAAALLKQLDPSLAPWEVKLLLQYTATPVVNGVSSPTDGLNQGHPAMPGPFGACGFGLVNATLAALALPYVQAHRAGFQAALGAAAMYAAARS